MKKTLLVVLLGVAVSLGLAAQESDPSAYHLIVIDRAQCPGATVTIAEPLAVIAHGKTGYYIIFGKGAVTIPSGAMVIVELTSKIPSVIYGYLEDPSFRRFVSSPGVLEGFKFAVKEAGK